MRLSKPLSTAICEVDGNKEKCSYFIAIRNVIITQKYPEATSNGKMSKI